MTNQAKLASTFVKRKIDWLTGTENDPAAKATLAKLRRGIGKAPGSLPDLWDITLSGLPENLLSKNGDPTYGEWAVHVALTLYALHQQGKDLKVQCMNREGEFFGVAARKLLEHDKSSEDAVMRRFRAAVASDSYERFSWHLRGLVYLFRDKGIPLDYPALTEDLYWFQVPGRRDSIRLRWGQDLYRIAAGESVHKDAQANS